MRTRKDYESALVLVGSSVRAWDPYKLLESGAPDDEFDAEIARVVALLPRITSPAAAAAALSSAFSTAFEPTLCSPAQWMDLGQELFGKLAAAGLVARSSAHDSADVATDSPDNISDV